MGVGGARTDIGIVILGRVGQSVPASGTEVCVGRRARVLLETVGVRQRVEIGAQGGKRHLVAARQASAFGRHRHVIGGVGLETRQCHRGVVHCHRHDAVFGLSVGHILHLPAAGRALLAPRHRGGVSRHAAGGHPLHTGAIWCHLQLEVVHIGIPVVVHHTLDGHKGAVAGVAVQADDKVAIGGVGDGHRAHPLEGVDVVGVGHHAHFDDGRSGAALVGPERDLQRVDGVYRGVHIGHHQAGVRAVARTRGGGVPIHVLATAGGVVVARPRGYIRVIILVGVGAACPAVDEVGAAGAGGRRHLKVHHVRQRVHGSAVGEYRHLAHHARVAGAADACNAHSVVGIAVQQRERLQSVGSGEGGKHRAARREAHQPFGGFARFGPRRVKRVRRHVGIVDSHRTSTGGLGHDDVVDGSRRIGAHRAVVGPGKHQPVGARGHYVKIRCEILPR